MIKPPCPICGRRRPLGRCNFAGGKVDVTDHCRSCCSAPERDAWKALPVTRAKKAAARGA